jgi:hypothetical protein
MHLKHPYAAASTVAAAQAALFSLDFKYLKRLVGVRGFEPPAPASRKPSA